ncbi:tyrosine-type recombinase/integrase [Halomonas sp.]|uniref:tyrosine-type recombinase/integrase n=1 Tax=Halomonas sp. TaxID=1486246 RepID=UPI003D12DEAA
MSELFRSVWEGWNLLVLPEAAGGAEARRRQQLRQRQQGQLEVLAQVNEYHPGLVSGECDITVPDELPQQWVDHILSKAGASAAASRHKLNFLVQGLRQGERQLGWKVRVPAPMHHVQPEASPFTPDALVRLNAYRDWCCLVEEGLKTDQFHDLLQHGNGLKGHRRLESEHISWGLLMYLAITRDGLLARKAVNSLPLAAATLATYGGTSWCLLHESPPEDLPEPVPPRSRWLLGASTLAVLMRHLDRYGDPQQQAKIPSYKTAKEFSATAWSAFCRAVGADKSMTLPACQAMAATALRLHVPRYLVDSALGKHAVTSIDESRWQQLLLGGYVQHSGLAEDEEERPPLPGSQPAEPDMPLERDQPIYKARELLAGLRGWLSPTRETKRRTNASITARLEETLAETWRMVPIAEWICRWLYYLHVDMKRKQSTLHTYLGSALPILKYIGDTPLSPSRLTELVEAYQQVIEEGKTEKNRHYRWTVLHGFHNFLVSELGLAKVKMEFVGSGAGVTYHADANILSETEYQLVAERLKLMDPSILGKIRYWVFVLGFRAGLRIGEALSIQVCDVQLKKRVPDTDVVLLVRDNEYVANKSYSSRRQLPLHHLLTEEELGPFKYYVINRQEMSRHSRVMLFGEGGESLAPLRDDKVSPAIHEVMRRVTGDPSVRFHHLRHSLANNLLLAFHGIPAPWAAPAHLNALWHEVTGGVVSRQGLHFIAQVMGHSSPDVTLRSYLHCTEWLMGHYLQHEPHSVEGARRPSPAVELEALAELLGLKPARVRKWKQRYGDRPAIWIRKAFPACPIVDVDDREPEPFPTLMDIQPVVHDRLHHLSLESLECLIDARYRYSSEELEQIFTLRAGEVKRLKQAERSVLLLPTRTGSGTYRHCRATKGKQRIDVKTGLPRLTRPSAVWKRRIINALYRSIWECWYEQNPDLLFEQLRYFYQYHRAAEGHVWIRDVDAGMRFVSWVLSLDPGVRANIEITPSARSSLTAKQQLIEWKKRLPSQRHKVEWSTKRPGRRYANELGTGNVAFWVFKDEKKRLSVHPVSYVLVIACIVMVAQQSA